MKRNYGSGEAKEKFSTLFDLGARGDEQDWEVQLADPSKLTAFLDCYERCDLSEDEKITLMLLIIASFDDYLYRTAPGAIGKRIKALLTTDIHLHSATVEYWASWDVEEEDSFACSPLMRAISLETRDG